MKKARVRILKNQLIGNGKLQKTTCRFQMLLFVSQVEQYFFTEIEIEWCQLNKALQTKRFRAVQKAHQNYIFSITKKEPVLHRQYLNQSSPSCLQQLENRYKAILFHSSFDAIIPEIIAALRRI